MPHKRLFLAFGAGLGLSVSLAVLEALRHYDAWVLLQAPGFFAAALIWGVHSGGYSFEAIMVIVNGAIYSLLFLFASWLLRLRKS